MRHGEHDAAAQQWVAFLDGDAEHADQYRRYAGTDDQCRYQAQSEGAEERSALELVGVIMQFRLNERRHLQFEQTEHR